MNTHPGEEEVADGRACQKMGYRISPTTMTGKQILALLLVVGLVGIVCELIFG